MLKEWMTGVRAVYAMGFLGARAGLIAWALWVPALVVLPGQDGRWVRLLDSSLLSLVICTLCVLGSPRTPGTRRWVRLLGGLGGGTIAGGLSFAVLQSIWLHWPVGRVALVTWLTTGASTGLVLGAIRHGGSKHAE